MPGTLSLRTAKARTTTTTTTTTTATAATTTTLKATSYSGARIRDSEDGTAATADFKRVVNE